MATDGPIPAEPALLPRMVGDGPGAAAGRTPDRALLPDRHSITGETPMARFAPSPADVADIGVTGMAVMGSNLARNLARNGFKVAIHNRSVGDRKSTRLNSVTWPSRMPSSA